MFLYFKNVSEVSDQTSVGSTVRLFTSRPISNNLSLIHVCEMKIASVNLTILFVLEFRTMDSVLHINIVSKYNVSSSLKFSGIVIQ